MVRIGTPLSPHATRVLLLGSGELGKEVAIELARFGIEVVAVDRYPGAPAMGVATRWHVVDMLDPDALRALLADERPDVVVPEVEAIATHVLAEVEEDPEGTESAELFAVQLNAYPFPGRLAPRES